MTLSRRICSSIRFLADSLFRKTISSGAKTRLPLRFNLVSVDLLGSSSSSTSFCNSLTSLFLLAGGEETVTFECVSNTAFGFSGTTTETGFVLAKAFFLTASEISGVCLARKGCLVGVGEEVVVDAFADILVIL